MRAATEPFIDAIHADVNYWVVKNVKNYDTNKPPTMA
jgi:hypothetical protein